MNVTISADGHSIDETGYVWTLLSDSAFPDRVRPGAVGVAGDPDAPFMARVVDLVAGPTGDQIVHLDVLGTPDELLDELAHAGAIPRPDAATRPPSRHRRAQGSGTAGR